MVGEYDSNNLKNQFTFKVTFNNMSSDAMQIISHLINSSMMNP